MPNTRRSNSSAGTDKVYAEGARHSAPQAQQVADRFHLCLNLSTAVEQELARHGSFLSLPRPINTTTASLEGGASASKVARNRQGIVDARRVAKQALFETVEALHASGETVSGIVREAGISRQRVGAWVGLVELPERNRMAPNPSTPAFYEEHLAQRWTEGFQHGRKLLKEIQALGYTGCVSYLARFLARWRHKTHDSPEFCDHDADCEGRPAGGFEQLPICERYLNHILSASADWGKLGA